MIRVAPIESWHFRSINVQRAQRDELEMVLDQMHIGMRLVGENRAYNGTIMDGAEILCIAGVHNLGEHGAAWAFLAEGIEGRMTPVIRTVFRYMLKFSLTKLPIYANISPYHAEAQRWASLLGFEPTGEADIWCFMYSAQPQS